MKKILAILLALVATTSLWAFKQENLYYNIIDEKKSHVEVGGMSERNEYYQYITHITVPSTVKMYGKTYTVVGIYDGAFKDLSHLRTITLPSTITHIGKNAFANSGVYANNDYWSNGIMYINNCLIATRNFVSGDVTIKNGTRVIAEGAFSGCSSLTDITIPSSVKSIGDEAFSFCYNLTSLTIPYTVETLGHDIIKQDSKLSIIITAKSVEEYCKSSINLKLREGKCHNPRKLVIAGKEVKNLVIPSSVKQIKDYAFYKCSGLISVTIPEGVKSIGLGGTFQGCTALQSVQWNATNCTIDHNSDGKYYPPFHELSSITSFTFGSNVQSIPAYLCYGLSGLTSITIPESVTSIGKSAFAYCSGLTSVTIPNSVTSIEEWAFGGCSSLKSVTIPEGVTSIGGGAFRDCSSLKSVTIPEGVTSIEEGAFHDCSSLKSVTIPEGVTSVGEKAFYGCKSLTDITIPESVTSIGEAAFSFCESLTAVTIPNSLTNIGDYAFLRCESLTSVAIPSTVTSIGEEAFRGCSSLTSITISSSVTSIGVDAFYGCSSQTRIIVLGKSNKHIPYYNGSIIYGDAIINGMVIKDNTVITVVDPSITAVTIPASVKSIGTRAFDGCKSLKSVIINSNDIANRSNLMSIFGEQVTEYIIGNSVKSIGKQAFRFCPSLSSIVVEGGNTAFDSRENCNAIIETATNTLIAGCRNTIIPNGVTSIGDYAFYGCSSLTDITIPASVTSIAGGAFHDCSSLKSVTIPASVTSIGVGAFRGCSSLKSVTINSDKVANSVNLKDVFGSQVTAYILGNSVKSIGDEAFAGCEALTGIMIPESVTSIGYRAFYNCKSLTSVTIPASVTSIGAQAFYGCSALQTINYTGTKKQWKGIEDTNLTIEPKKQIVVHCTDGNLKLKGK